MTARVGVLLHDRLDDGVGQGGRGGPGGYRCRDPCFSLRLDGEYIRDETGQATNIREVLEIFDTEGVDSAFIWLFELCNFPHRPDGDPRDGLDLASPAIVKTLEGRHGDTNPDMTWEPKAAFTVVADCYGN